MIASFSGVSLRRGRRCVLRDLNLEIGPGEFVGVIGPNGAGKTTLLESLVGEIAYEGSLRVFGREIREIQGHDRARLRTRIGLVPQVAEHTAAVPLTVGEVVAIGRAGRAGMLRRLSAADRSICASWADRLGLGTLQRRPYSDLSGGERRKVHLARALAQEPELLLLDEPAGHLDLRWQEELTFLVERLWRDTRVSVVMVTHEFRHVPAGATRLVLLGQGRVLASGSDEDVLRPDVLASAFGVEVEAVRRGGRLHLLPRERRSGEASEKRVPAPRP